MTPLRIAVSTQRLARRVAACVSVWLMLVLTTFAVQAEPIFVLPAAERIHVQEFSRHIGLLEDPAGTLSVDDVTRASFSPSSLAAANVGFTTSVWWARVTLSNQGPRERELYLRQTYPLIDYLDVYEQTGPGQWRTHRTGDRRPFAARDIAHRDLVFPIYVPAGAERVVYLRYQSQGAIDISLSLYSSPELLESFSREQLAYGIYYGCVIMLLVWSSLVFIAVRDKAFLAYFAYVATFGLYMLIHNGLAYQYLWPESPRWGNTSLIALIMIALFAGLQFSRMILRAREVIPRLDLGARVVQGVAVVLLLASPFVRYSAIIAPIALLVLMGVIYMLTLGISAMALGSRPARFYVIAWSSFLCGSVVFLLKTFGMLPHTFLTQNGWQIGSLLEMILLSMTLSTRMNELQHQSRTDPLTLLGNRRLFDDRLPEEFLQAREQQRPLSLLVLDIDHFKSYNDRHGHARGDEAIKAVGHALRKFARKPLLGCRYGGEEFTVILPGVDCQTAALMSERLRRTIEETLHGDLAITISIGYACLDRGQFESADKFFEAADSALYTAKQRGRNCVVAFHERNPEGAPAQPRVAIS
ncbi:GGDEF domain-containing protein [Steroidobacter sp. S1-65]|uniref:diguanylate cyclase n=1 Tax=Steroidobacter gossypii TaxID=2805490 RepID=A0ABS1WRT2_9GAMM|nr:diguanylate cyclase [Steroidobacter gossypii]MBM0103667.1 GGDEF domain-containing protein [Steroidobacter gossypii]